ncbi:MAG: tetratricopeptide repeat protein, partial [Candidatus Cloacimonadaceae bacterium]|nr:tetratricopeptide repeat protein [Candidatus Cloacimonadaceae bacterium]
MRKLLLIILLLLACSITLAQYNEKDILAQQAYQLLARRQFTEAEAIFIQILEKFPNDVNSVVQLLQIYFQTSQLDKAESTLNRYRNVLPELSAEEQTIQLFVMQGLPAQAWSLSMTHLQKQRHDIHRYRIIASYFERRGFYEQVLDLYRQARIQHSNDTLFMLEIANTALNFRLFGMALTEYLRFLEANPTNIYHINNQCKIIMAQDSTMINVIGEYANASGNAAVKELYANSLLSMGRQKLALSVYKQLPWDKLHRFAEDQFIALVDETAYPAYAHLIEITQDKIRRAEYLYRMAQIDFRNNRFAGCDSLLLRIIDDPTLVERQYRNRSQINFNARKL